MNAVMLGRSMYVLVTPVFLFLAIIACAGTPLVDTPIYTCPTDVPEPTATTLPGTPPSIAPLPTPYVITPPQDFYMGDVVDVGSVLSPLRVRLRLQNVQITSYSADQQVVSWQLSVSNIGQETYEIFPSLQMFVSEVETAYGTETGTWGATQDAGDVVDVPVDSDLYQLTAGQSQTFRLAAFTPMGDRVRFAFQMDPAQGTDSPVMTWINQVNPYCSGDVAP